MPPGVGAFVGAVGALVGALVGGFVGALVGAVLASPEPDSLLASSVDATVGAGVGQVEQLTGQYCVTVAAYMGFVQPPIAPA